MPEQEEVLKEVPIEWDIPPSIVTRPAMNIVVQHTEHEFVISFFEVHPPFVLGSDEEKGAIAERITSVRAECVARVTVAAGRMPEFVEVLRRNLEAYQAERAE